MAIALTASALLAGCALSVPCDLHDKHYGFLCAFARHRDLPPREEHGLLMGSVQVDPPPIASIVVFVYQTRAGRAAVVDSQILPPHGPYSFVFTVPAGVYRLAAFEDQARDLHYDPGRDRAAVYHEGGPVVLMPGQTVDRLYLRLRNDRPQRIYFDVVLTDRSGQSPQDGARREEVRNDGI